MTFPLMTPAPTPEQDQQDVDRLVREAQLRAKEAQWWYLWPGEEGWDQPLHEYLGFASLDEWREYAISKDRGGSR